MVKVLFFSANTAVCSTHVPFALVSDRKIGIAIPLHNPSDTLLATYEHSDIVAVRDSAYFFACTVGLMLIPRVVIWIFQEFCTINVVELDDASLGG